MKKMILLFALASLTDLSVLSYSSKKSGYFKKQKKMVIGASGGGFFAEFLGTLNHIAWCEKNSVTPVVYWNSGLYYEPAGYNGSKNVWEYYFEPVSSAQYRKKDRIRRAYEAPDGSHIKGFHDKCKSYNTRIELKMQVHDLIKKYIKIKPVVMGKVNSFYTRYMEGKYTIGVHLRGTDKHIEVLPTSITKILDIANEAARGIPDCQFLVATDEVRLLEKAKELLHGKVIYYDSQRSNTDQAIHTHGKNKALLGEEVLIEVLLLSQCKKLIHTCSNVSSAALFFNPTIENTLVNAE